MQLEEILMTDLSGTGFVTFPKILSRDSIVIKPKTNLTRARIGEIISEAMLSAEKDAADVSMIASEINLELFLKKMNIQLESTQVEDDNLPNIISVLNTMASILRIAILCLLMKFFKLKIQMYLKISLRFKN